MPINPTYPEDRIEYMDGLSVRQHQLAPALLFYVYKAETAITKNMLMLIQADSRLMVAGSNVDATTYFITKLKPC